MPPFSHYAPDNEKTRRLLKRLREFQKQREEKRKANIKIWTDEDELLKLNK